MRSNAVVIAKQRMRLAADRRVSDSLPPETIAEGVRRLGWLALLYAVGQFAGPITRLVMWTHGGTVNPWTFGIPDAFALGTVPMGLAMFAVVRSGRVPERRLLDLGLAFYVAGAVGIAVPEFWHGLPPTESALLLVPGECVWLVAYPILVPDTPRRVLTASLLAATAGPAALAMAAVATDTPLSRPLAVGAYFLTSSYMAAILAYVIARVVHRVNQRLKDALQIGSYELIEPIGAGGMGAVWRAEHRMLARPAAIKLIRSAMLGDTERSRDALRLRFQHEARATALLRSIHTIDIYDFGVTDEGDFYYAMELLDGLSLEQLVQRFGAIDPARAVYLLHQVCHSLGEAHAAGLVHRDIKPANILVCRLGPDHDFVKVLDFGLVKQTGEGETVSVVSRPGGVLGTPGYIAPEVALGRPFDARADLYSLGCVAYYLLTGLPVFSGDAPLAVAVAHAHDMPVPPGLRSNVSVPAALERLIMECLAKDPNARPRSAAVVDERLATAVAADPWTADAARQWWVRHQPLEERRPARYPADLSGDRPAAAVVNAAVRRHRDTTTYR
jgi:serine/threonine-protein kinase